MNIPLANYDEPRQAYQRLFDQPCAERILLLQGDSGSGKTALLQHCSEQIPKPLLHVPIQLRGSAVSISEIFSRSGRLLGWERLSAFTQQIAALQNAPAVKIDRNWLLGIQNSINVALHVDNPEGREQRRAAVTEAWFDDVERFSQPVLLVFDTYEQATSEVQQWLSGPFLARTAQVERMRVVVAGQTVPDPHNIEWGACASQHQLYGVPEARHWLPVVEALGRRIPVEPPLTWLAGICYALKGDPKSIHDVIKALPRRESQP